MSTYTMMDGTCRLYESTDTLRSAVTNAVVEKDDTVYTDKTAAARSAAGSTTGDVLEVAADDALYVGHSSPFARIQVDLSTVAAGKSTLVVKYWNGTNWTSEVADLVDGTAVGGHALAQDGAISFTPPSDWAAGDGGLGDLTSTNYYVVLTVTADGSDAPDFEQIYPVDGLYFALIFTEGNLTFPEGRGRPEETAIMDRGRIDSNYHYVMGTDEPILEPLEVSFSIRLDTVINKAALLEALVCDNPVASTWSAVGTSTKTDTALTSGTGSSVTTVAFEDASKKTLCLQILWTKGSVAIGRELNEVWFDLAQCSIAESEDGVIITCTGLVYGSIRTIYHHAYQY